MKTVGLLGGSFNPAHAGHRHISVEALRRLDLDEVWWLVSPQNPLKASTDMAPLAARVASANVVARHRRIVVSDLEVGLGTRYAVDTVAVLLRRYPKVRFVWLMGADNLVDFDHWSRWRALALLVPIAVFARPGYMGRALTAPAMAWFRRWRHASASVRRWREWRLPAIVVLDIRMSPLSATAIRSADPNWADPDRASR
ncbi:nicotinate-nucleotide adenylyltransferase [Polymorphobacter sp. PAMC 29334]|uniref:nicotinate-nucleotide adenylyltransferase n=1 Tax=Polymorphobacter sp. PAMC 29334 TaxID=2862331 RepID=UPI001C7876F9|nr:nicotinate-nucleotide adenylyltransferase [Polymorphobacter sp. PAMC 29334]QYE36658.1 nicotinate-nucleotide adenylyltransferase [Polymorphobacter sp. PAMC 29334]